MAYKPPLSEGELHSSNLRAIRKWLAAHKGLIKARPNQSVLYSGRIYDLDVLPDMPKEDREAFKGSPVWMSFEKHRKLHAEKKIPFNYQTLEEVLKSIRDCPVMVDKDRQEQVFRSAFDFFEGIKAHADLLPNAKAVYIECWESLSTFFAANAEGDIRILDGHMDDFGKLNQQKILLRKELEALMKNSKLSAAGKALVLKKVTKYGEQFDRRYTELTRQLDLETAQLKRPHKR